MENINKENWKTLLAESENAVVLDVRTPAEWSGGIQRNAVKLNFLDGAEFMSGIEKLDKSKTYFIYCRSGNRSGQACQIMEAKGFAKTYNLLGGMMSWDGEIV